MVGIRSVLPHKNGSFRWACTTYHTNSINRSIMCLLDLWPITYYYIDFRYDYTCVIYGWDQECTATQEWIVQMGVHNLPHKQYQPFYNVLVEDGSNRYAAEGKMNFYNFRKNATTIFCVIYARIHLQEIDGERSFPGPSNYVVRLLCRIRYIRHILPITVILI